MSENLAEKYPHYHKDVSHLQSVDFYRVAELFGVTDQAIGHAIKKLLAAGQRGAKDQRQDIKEAMDSLIRKLQMMDEDERKAVVEKSALPVEGTSVAALAGNRPPAQP